MSGISSIRTRMSFSNRLTNWRLSSHLANGNDTSLELDSHADTCVLGKDALIFLDHKRPVNIHGYDPALGSKRYQTVLDALAYDNPGIGQVYQLLVNQAIKIPELDRCLLCPFQCRFNEVTIDDIPIFLTPSPTVATHAISVTIPDEPGQLLRNPLSQSG